MKDKSKIIFFIVDISNRLEKAYKYSLFSKLCCRIAIVWNNSIFGKIISGFFNIETHKSSVFYKCIKSAINILVKGIIEKFPFKTAVNNSKYINIIKKFYYKIRPDKENIAKTMLNDSFFINSIYEFWLGID